MITLSNGHSFTYMVASGALGFDGKGWWWERPLLWAGLIRPELFTVVLKTLTRHPREGNMRWWKPWESVRLLPGRGVVNKIGLTNPGIAWWLERVAPTIDMEHYPVVVSLAGSEAELAEMGAMLERLPLRAIELNVSCPNTGDRLPDTRAVVRAVQVLRRSTRHPIIVKVSVAQEYLAVSLALMHIAEAIALNSVPWKVAFHGNIPSPLVTLERRVGGGGGGVSGVPAQSANWAAVATLVRGGGLPVIAPSIMQFEDIARVRALGARAVSFGSIHTRTPWRPTSYVMRDIHKSNDPRVMV